MVDVFADLFPTNDLDLHEKWFGRYPNPLLTQAVGQIEGSIGWPSWSLLYHLCRATLLPGRTNNIVEFGSQSGFTTLVLAQALADTGSSGVVVTHEIDRDLQVRALQHASMAGLSDRIEVRGDAFESPLPQHVTFGFVDFTKSESANRRAFDRLVEVMHPRGTIVFDNAWSGGIPQALQSISDDGHAVLLLPRASWGDWPPSDPKLDRGTPGMAIVQLRAR